jgi:hypothetical protein
VRVVPLYAAMKMPGKGQMVDDIASFINTLCSIDHRTGKILRGQDARRLGGTDMAVNPVTGYSLAGAQIPHWPEVMQLAHDVHEVFSQQGLKCIDVAVTPIRTAYHRAQRFTATRVLSEGLRARVLEP